MTQPALTLHPASHTPLLESHAGSLLAGWLGFGQVGLSLSRTLNGPTHWVTTTHFTGSLPIPRFRIYLGTTRVRLAASDHWLIHRPAFPYERKLKCTPTYTPHPHGLLCDYPKAPFPPIFEHSVP